MRPQHELILTSHFVIEYVEPPTEERRWAQNKTIDIVCETAERAVELFRKVSSIGRIDVIRRVGTNRTLFIDPLAIKESLAGVSND